MDLSDINSYYYEAQKLFYQRELTKALLLSNQMIDKALEDKYLSQIRDFKLLKGEILTTLGIYSQNPIDIKIAIDYCKSFDNENPRVFEYLGKLHLQNRHFEKAQYYFEKSQNIAKNDTSATDTFILSYTYLGFLKFYQFQEKEALAYAHEAEQFIQKMDCSSRTLNKNNQLLAFIFIPKNDKSELKRIGESLVKNSSELEDIESYLVGCHVLGLYEGLNGQYQLALEQYNVSKQLSERIGYGKFIIENYLGLANIFRILKKYESAVDACKIVYEHYFDRMNADRQVTLFINMGLGLWRLEEDSQMKFYLEKGLEISEKHQLFQRKFMILSLFAEYFSKKNQLKEALPYLLASEELLEKGEFKDKERIRLLTILAYNYYFFKNYEKAEILFLEILKFNDENGILGKNKNCFFYLYKIYKYQKKFEQSLSFFEKYEAENEKYLKESSKKATLQLEVQYQTRERKKELELLKTQMKYQELELNQKISNLYLQALRSQMNPHFVFNALNGIQKFIANGENEQAMIYLARFAKLIRMIFELTKKEWIRLSEEVEFLSLYLGLEKFRFEDRIDIQFDVDKNIGQNDISLPPLLIQPIAENAFKHGLLHKRTGGKLKIFITKNHQNFLKCTIEDNGVGREQAKLLSTWRYNQQKSSGLNIIEKRLAIINERENNNLKIIDLISKNKASKGTRIELLIKIKERVWDS